MGRGEVVVLGSGVKLSCLLHLHRKSLKTDNSSCNPVFMEISEKTTGILSQLRAKLRDWAVRPVRAGCYSRAALSLTDSKTRYK